MPTPSINIGICRKGKDLLQSIDDHFRYHEPYYYENLILTSSVLLTEEIGTDLSIIIDKIIKGDKLTDEEEQIRRNNKDEIEIELNRRKKAHKAKSDDCKFEIIKDGEFVASEKKDIKSWFEYDLYAKIKNLVNLVEGNVGDTIIVNIILPIIEEQSLKILEKLLKSIQELSSSEIVGGLSVRIFSIIFPFDNKDHESDMLTKKQLKELEELSNKFDSLIHDIFYFDDKNNEKVHLNLNLKWLGFALGEYFVFQMNEPGSLAMNKKNKMFGVGIVHFNEVLFREVIANKILQYKFVEEGIVEDNGVQLQDILNKCNPFIKDHQNFFDKFAEKHPYSIENESNLTSNSKQYITDFKNKLDQFITDEKNKIGESKAILANLLGEDDDKLEGLDWKAERLSLKDLEFDIIDYFNKFVGEEDNVDLTKEKELKEKLTDLKHGIKRDEKTIKRINAQSNEIHSNLDISFDKGIFSVDGKRINASGYIPSPISPSDEVYSFKDEVIASRIDLSSYFGSIKNQGKLGSCTSFPVAGVYEFAAIRNNKTIDISELFIYYNTRVINGNIKKDSGATLIDTINSVKEKGACYTDTHHFDIENFDKEPSEKAYSEAKHQVVEKAYRVNVCKKDFKQAIANGHPVIFGLKLFKSFYPKNNSGIVPYPSTNETSLQNHGNHAMLLVGYNDDEKLFKVRNSWGAKFGDNGYCYIPYDYVTNPNFCQEAFVITQIVDLSYDEFNYDTGASFSFLKDALVRKKIIAEYSLRAKNKNLVRVKEQYDITALKNEENAAQIKDPGFRKRIYNELKNPTSAIQEPVQATAPEILEKKSKTPWFLIGGGVAVLILSILLIAFITPIGTGIGVVIGAAFIGYGIFDLIRSEKTKVEPPQPNGHSSEDNNLQKDLYLFMAADRLFDEFDSMGNHLITRYLALSKYFSKVKKWQEESLDVLGKTEYSSPTFVFNVVEKKPLMEYIAKEKAKFLQKLPNLSAIFHNKYQPEHNNEDEVFDELKKNYIKYIKENTDSIIDVSIVDYLLGKKYPYFNDPPKLEKIMSNLEKVSLPFCNLKSIPNTIETQHYVLNERIENDKAKKQKNIAKNRNAAMRPVIIERDDNRKKYVSIQVSALDSIENLVRY